MILDELKSGSPNFDRLCNELSEIQRLTRSGNKGYVHEKEVHLSTVEGEFQGKCRNCSKVCGYQAKECKRCKGNLYSGRTSESKGGNTSNSGSSKTCNFYGLKGHRVSQCFKKNSDKAPEWWKEKNTKTESASSSVEVTLASFGNPAIEGINMKELLAVKCGTLAVLCQKDVWICNMGASTDVMWSIKGARNVRGTLTLSLGHSGGAVESTAIIDIPGMFMTNDGISGTRAVLKECCYSKAHNFNLLSMSRLLQQGWKVTCQDKNLIHIENRKGGKIEFDIVLPTKKGAIYACGFVRISEIATANTDVGKKVSVNIAHCLLGHQNEDSIQKTAQEQGWGADAWINEDTRALCKGQGQTEECAKRKCQ